MASMRSDKKGFVPYIDFKLDMRISKTKNVLLDRTEAVQ